MGKVTFEFDEMKDNQDIKNIINRNKLIYALDELKNYRRTLYKGYPNNEIIVKDKKVLAEGEERLSLKGDTKGQKAYIPLSDVIDELDRCLNNIKDLLDY